MSKPQADREYFEQKNRFKKAEQMERRRLDIERDQQRHERQKQEMLANRCGPRQHIEDRTRQSCGFCLIVAYPALLSDNAMATTMTISP